MKTEGIWKDFSVGLWVIQPSDMAHGLQVLRHHALLPAARLCRPRSISKGLWKAFGQQVLGEAY